MSAAAIAAMAVIQAEEARRRSNDPDYVPLCTVGALIDNPWAGPVLLLISLAFSAAMLYISFS